MSLESLQKRLTTLQETTSHIQTLIARLASFKFPPGAIPLNQGSLDTVATELSNEIHDTLKEQNNDFKLLEQEIKDSPGGRKGSDAETNKLRLLERATRTQQELKHAQSAFRKAQLAAKRNLDLSRRAERELLLQSLAALPSPSCNQPISRRRTPAAEQTQDEKLVGSAGDVTAALRQVHASMTNELSRSQFAHDTLKESGAALEQLGESYTSLDSVLASTKGLLGMLLKSQKSDTWYLETAFYVLLATISWLVFRRFIYGPAWWLVYLPLKMFWNAWMGVFTVLGLRGASSTVSVSSQSVGTMIMPASGTVAQVTMSGTDAPQVVRGGRGNAKPPKPPQEDDEGRPLVDIVGEMAEDTRAQGQEQPQEPAQPESNEGQQQEEQVQPNPKKRMWDSEVEARKEAEAEQKRKDEL
ncbi:hypothetical protein VC83_02191 [Pseudogymnoascus destructans]|uniref:Sec20 C-terminal domain-containing protein n=2 Tax=Pseudogymnoascus destructans TaxID=655981 RepID=L8GCF5_PSED2|nr:uncharacterized protein VC83_02191 [Pseudogymnoascus destructans]ELR10358.1 hypothetical protein GMDG_04740 [Pseudogymnoascus destructans 20631-21]OAF61435.1 hypothetical protein VC83_02191 [Pseudogymnoascus destructans]